MALIRDRVKETTTTTGTGTVTLGGAASGFRSFGSAVSDQDTVYYCIQGTTEWEVGIGVFTTSGTTLSRLTVEASSNAGALVNFSAGTKDVWNTMSAASRDELTMSRFVPTNSTIIPEGYGASVVGLYEILPGMYTEIGPGAVLNIS